MPYKGADILIEAAEPLLRAARMTLDLIGDGPQLSNLKSQISDPNLPGVTFVGQVPHDALAGRLVEYDVLGFPSIREFGGAVALEAMALGVVPIVPNYGGLGELVTDATGYRVSMGTREELVARYREVLTSICDDPRRLAPRSTAAILRARGQFTWDAKAAQVTQVYDWLLGRNDKPTFLMPTPDC